MFIFYQKIKLKLVVLCVGKRAFIAGIADDNGYGWAIAKSLAAAGAEILVGTWVPVSKSS
jgi:enoyl-[acyl-carrier-protein] reductase (NADH)